MKLCAKDKKSAVLGGRKRRRKKHQAKPTYNVKNVEQYISPNRHTAGRKAGKLKLCNQTGRLCVCVYDKAAVPSTSRSRSGTSKCTKVVIMHKARAVTTAEKVNKYGNVCVCVQMCVTVCAIDKGERGK